MALTESIQYDKIEIVTEYRHVQVRKATVIKKDGKELTRSFHRYVLDAGTLDVSNNFVENPLDKEPDGVTNIPCLLYTSPSPRDKTVSRMPSSA